MTPFIEIPPDPNWPNIVRMTIASQPDEYYRRFFCGRLPTPEERREHVERSVRLLTPVRLFQNNLYRVEIVDTPPITPTFIHLAVSRHDKGTCNEWADLQRIKNEIVGPEYEAIELFPAESRLVNTGNEYHLWVHSNPSYRFPVGWVRRMVFSEPLRIVDGSSQNAGSLDNTATHSPIPVGTLRLTAAGQQNPAG